MKFTASRLSEGNKIFPAEIHTEENGLTVKIPGFLSGKSTFLAYENISSVSVDTPMIGYSTINFNAMGSTVSVHGFTKDEVKQIKAAIDNGKINTKTISNGCVTIVNQRDSGASSAKKGIFDVLSESMEQESPLQKMANARKEATREIQSKVEEIAQITIGTTPEEIQNVLSHLVSIASTKPDNKVKNAIVEKMEFGIMKLRAANSNSEADYFEKKLEPLKKKGLFGF